MNIPQIKARFRTLYDMLHQGYVPDVINTAIELGLFEALAEEPMDARRLAAKLGTIENLTETFANTLVALKLLEKSGDEYSLAPMAAEFLVKSSPAYQGGMIAMGLKFGQVMSQMSHILKSSPVRSPEAESDMWLNIDAMKSIGQGVMGGSIQEVTEFITSLPEFPNLRHMCDLAGSHGFYTMALLDKNPQLRGTIVDLPKVAELAKDLVVEMGYGDRIDTIGADLETNNPIGEGYDLVLASHVLYIWKGHLEDIFEKINKAMVPGGVFVSNHLSMAGDECGPVSEMMVELMTQLGGYPTHHLSEAELKKALERCGFGNFTVRPAEEGRQYRSLILVARKLKRGDKNVK